MMKLSKSSSSSSSCVHSTQRRAVTGSNGVKPQPLRVAVIPGDGIGKEVTPCGVRVLEKACNRFDVNLHTSHFPFSCDYYRQHGRMMPDDGLSQLRPHHAILLGAVGDPERVPDHHSLHGLLLAIRKGFGLRVNVRPARGYPGLGVGRALDVVVVRENSEGEYAGIGGRVHGGGMIDINNNNNNIGTNVDSTITDNEIAIQTAVHSRSAITHTINTAFTLSRQHQHPHVTLATKSNAMPDAFRLWEEVFAQQTPSDITTRAIHVDALAAGLVRDPSAFSVIAASNLFGDILSDMTAAMQGSLGLAGSANINMLPSSFSSSSSSYNRIDESKQYNDNNNNNNDSQTPPSLSSSPPPGLFESVHGSAPDIAGRGVANPVATFNAVALLLRYNGFAPAADAVETAIETALRDVSARTPDLGGTATTEDTTRAVLSAL